LSFLIASGSRLTDTTARLAGFKDTKTALESLSKGSLLKEPHLLRYAQVDEFSPRFNGKRRLSARLAPRESFDLFLRSALSRIACAPSDQNTPRKTVNSFKSAHGIIDDYADLQGYWLAREPRNRFAPILSRAESRAMLAQAVR
jgi:hypothetical protein